MRGVAEVLIGLFAALPLIPQSLDNLKLLRETLVPMRGHASENPETRGATPAFTLVKHALRDWIGSQLSGLTPQDDPGALARKLNAELQQSKLFCDDSSDDTRCPEDSQVGFLANISLEVPVTNFLIVRTSVGIQCGFDDSAYAYNWTGSRWALFWESEQNRYTGKEYLPQRIEQVLISPATSDRRAERAQRVVVTLGILPWCSSNWQRIYYRVWQTKKSYAEPRLLLDENDEVFLGAERARVDVNEILIEYAVRSIDGGILSRSELRHYVLDHGAIRRIDPVALSPRDFADNWLRHPWNESALWTLPSVRAKLKKLHQQRNEFSGEFIYPTLHCEQRPNLWQVGIEFDKPQYFLIRRRPPYHFTMVDVSDHPWPDCTEEDRSADEAPALLPQ